MNKSSRTYNIYTMFVTKCDYTAFAWLAPDPECWLVVSLTNYLLCLMFILKAERESWGRV